MATTHHRTIALPDNLTVTILRLPDHLTALVLRQILSAELYILAGATTSPAGHETGFGAYVGTSGALHQSMARAGVSLRQWTFRVGRLRPEVVIMVNRPGQPIDANARLLIEASLARAISTRWTVLNTRTAAPTAALAATRHQRLWAMQTSERLAALVLEQVFHPHPAAACGGTTREQLIRLMLAQRPPRAMNTRQVLRAAHAAGITIAGQSPAQRTRRDLTTRERDGATGRPRLLRTYDPQGRTVIYPAEMTLRQARASYATTHHETPHTPTRKPRQGPPPSHNKNAS